MLPPRRRGGAGKNGVRGTANPKFSLRGQHPSKMNVKTETRRLRGATTALQEAPQGVFRVKKLIPGGRFFGRRQARYFLLIS